MRYLLQGCICDHIGNELLNLGVLFISMTSSSVSDRVSNVRGGRGEAKLAIEKVKVFSQTML